MNLDTWSTQVWGFMPVRPHTLYNYQCRYGKHVSPVFGHMELEDIDRKKVQLWVLQSDPKTGSHSLAVLSTLLTQAVEYDLIPVNPCLKVKKKPYTPPRRDFSPLEDLENICPPKYLAPILFVARHGLRASEAYALTPGDIASAESSGILTINKTIYGPATKSGHARGVPYMGGYAKLPVSRQFRTCLKPYVFHSLRKTYAYWLKTKGVHITTIQKLLGHSNIQTTMIYLDSLDSEVLEVGKLLRNSEIERISA